MKPDSEGVWEWYDDDGTKRLVSVFNVGRPLGELYLRVAWWGGYYNVDDEHDPEHPEHDKYTQAEWPDRWGIRVGDIGCVSELDIYNMPTPEQMIKIRKEEQERFL